MSLLLALGAIIHQRYQVRQFIGQGDISAVYVATDQILRSMVALKQMFLTPHLALQQMIVLEHAFGHEAHRLHLLRHPIQTGYRK